MGKSTIADKLEEVYGYKVVQSYTDRPARTPNEKGHIFVSPKEFDEIQSKGLVAYTFFDGHRYGVPASMIDESDIYIIDPFGVEFLNKLYKGPKKIAVIGLTESVSVLIQRMEERGSTNAKIRDRLNHDIVAFSGMDKICDILIKNETIEETVSIIRNFIERREN